jgi:hypothetical protein
LLNTNFFEKDAIGQKSILVNFYLESIAQALKWQNSPKRHAVVPEKIWGGIEYQNSARLEHPKSLYQVSSEYILALGQQDKLLAQLVNVVGELAPRAGLSKPYLKYNHSGWKYRGLWMKLRMDEPEEEIPEGSFPYKFMIDLYNNPSLLRFIGAGKELILDLEEQYYFSLDEVNQKKSLELFIWTILKQIK